MKFVLTVLDGDHMLLSTADTLDANQMQQVGRAFDTWKARGGLLILQETVALDRYGIDLTLDLEGQSARDRLILPGVTPPPENRPAEATHERFINGDIPEAKLRDLMRDGRA